MEKQTLMTSPENCLTTGFRPNARETDEVCRTLQLVGKGTPLRPNSCSNFAAVLVPLVTKLSAIFIGVLLTVILLVHLRRGAHRCRW